MDAQEDKDRLAEVLERLANTIKLTKAEREALRRAARFLRRTKVRGVVDML